MAAALTPAAVVPQKADAENPLFSRRAVLQLADGTEWKGFSFGAARSTSGECVFQTGMVGYVESLTDPSYCAASVDRWGFPQSFESSRVHVSALIVGEVSEQFSHCTATRSLPAWLQEQGIPAIHGIDTRALIKHLRERGSLLATIVIEPDVATSITIADPNKENLVAKVSTKEIKQFGEGDKLILVVDCGMKYNQIRCFLKRGVRVKIVPYDHDFVNEQYDGLFLTNGPGDPTMCSRTIENLKRVLAARPAKPIFGICLGHQLLALAAGATTYKLRYGNRGHNQPCVQQQSQRCYLTSQNHGYAVDTKTLPADWELFYENANDKTNEGIRHKTLPFFSVQFHPEACAGPEETEFLFDVFLNNVRGLPSFESGLTRRFTQEKVVVRKVVLLGSGGLSIGQAGEFDYSGSQAIKALKEEGIETVLINPNIATVQTSTDLADTVYFLPVTPEFVTDVLEKERPDGILISFGGQTALNCGMELDKRGTFKHLGVRVLGTPLSAIQDTEDRGLFVQRLSEINEKAARSSTATTVEEALRQAEEIGYPVIVRAAFALGGLGSGFAHTKEELRELTTKALSLSEQVLVERSMKGWKEIEYEVVRDAFDNCVTVCNMENFDPLGIHTGESVVVAPSQTLTNADYQMLRNTSIKVIRHLGIVGECNIQYALNPDSNEYCIIEVNARLSRSSALASKATGYPLAFVAAKLALGYSLPSLRNSVTKSTTACFEPALDYIVVKMPLWDLKKFDKAQRQIGTAMKSVGEVMAIGRTFEEALQKAIRMANPSVQSPVDGFGSAIQEDEGELDSQLANPNDRRVMHLGQALHKGYDVERLHSLTRIDRWFLHKLHGIIQLEKKLGTYTAATLPRELLLRAKQIGFADRQIARCVASTEMAVRKLRQEQSVLPVVKQIDTVSAEFPAHNNYLYLTYSGIEHDVSFNESPGVVVLGSGGYRIGTSVEFDWSAVGCVKTLQSLGGRAIMLNCNPETVSTDYDVCDRLYFDELTLERVLDITELEHPQGIVLAVGGQIANNLAMPLYRQGVPVLGTNPEMIDAAENRYKFSRLLDTLGVSQPAWRQLSSLADARNFCASVQYPCLVRPSYVLSGASMKVVYTDEDLESFLVSEATVVSHEYPVVISKFISGAKEIEIDAVAVKGRILAQVVSEHVENAGVHSGDATIVCPPFDLRTETVTKIVEATRRIAGALDISGPFNIQYIAKENEIKVIECNVRASRSLPFVSKTMKIDLIALATKAILGRAADLGEITLEPPPYYGVKVPMFSFTRLRGADPVLGVDMASTGEVACFGRTPHEAYLKAQLATGFRLPKKSVLISIGSFAEKAEFVASARRLVELGYTLYGTPGTGDFLSEHGVAIATVLWDDEKAGAPQQLKSGQTDLYINLPSKNKYRRPATVMSHGYQTRRLAADLSIPLITNIKTAKFFVESLVHVPTLHRLSAYDSQMSRRIVTLPGLIDLHVHLREPGGEHKEDWDTGTAAALAGGFTIVAAMPNTKPAITNEESFALVGRLAAAKARCDYVIYVGASADNTQTAAALADRAAALKMYLNDTFSNLKLLDLATWGEHLQRWPAHVPIAVHAEGKTLAALLLMAVMHNRAVHVCHVSTKEELSLIQAAKAKGWKVTCEVCPHHLFLTHEGACCSLGSAGKAEVRPSLATEEDRAYLWANLASVDTFGTDHAPHTLEEKTSEKPPPGFPGLEAALPLLLTAVHEGKLALEDLIAKMHTNPRRIYNLPEQPDTYVEVDLDRVWTLPEKPQYSKCGWSPYAGRRVRGCVRRVVVRGVTAFVDGAVLAKPGTGLDLRAQPAERTPDVKRRLSVLAPSSPVVPHIPSSPSVSSLANTPLPHAPSEISAEALHLDRGVTAAFAGRHVLTVAQFTHSSLHVIFNLAHEMRLLVQRQGTTDLLKNRVMATAFYEPSTRTCTSFAAAMERLGGRVVSVTPETSSVAKGESLPDTIRTLESYVDITVLRHPEAGAAQLAARYARKPIINGGDGTGEHPTQALLDVFTIREERGTVHGLTVTLVGDLKHGRTVHSLVRLLSAYRPRLQYVSPLSLRMPREIVAELDALGIVQSEHERLEAVLPSSDVLYVTRIQKERFASAAEYEAVRNSFVITPTTLGNAKPNLIVMHPLPRVAEISPDVDVDPRAAYFRQMENGMYVRMALLLLVLGKI